jgi:hypothetical protein
MELGRVCGFVRAVCKIATLGPLFSTFHEKSLLNLSIFLLFIDSKTFRLSIIYRLFLLEILS